MSVQVRVAEGEDIDQALRRLRAAVHDEYGRPWYKRRYGFYEGPSVLHRKRRKMKRLCGGGPALYGPGRRKFRAHSPSESRVGCDVLFARTGPTTSAGR